MAIAVAIPISSNNDHSRRKTIDSETPGQFTKLIDIKLAGGDQPEPDCRLQYKSLFEQHNQAGGKPNWQTAFAEGLLAKF